VSRLAPSHHAYLITAGMEVPALIDPDTGRPVGIPAEGLDEAIGRYYLAVVPQHGTWQEALDARRRTLRRDTGMLGDVRYGIDQVRDVGAAARAAPRGILGAAREWKSALTSMGGDHHPAGDPVEGIGFEAWVEIRAALSREPAAGAQVDESAYAEARGIPAGRAPAIDSTWQQRVEWNQNARALYVKAMQDASG
jgi:hypothetical protein